MALVGVLVTMVLPMSAKSEVAAFSPRVISAVAALSVLLIPLPVPGVLTALLLLALGVLLRLGFIVGDCCPCQRGQGSCDEIAQRPLSRRA
jgi:hypothetical protein